VRASEAQGRSPRSLKLNEVTDLEVAGGSFEASFSANSADVSGANNGGGMLQSFIWRVAAAHMD